MKNNYLTILLILVSSFANSQSSTVLNQNNVSANIQDEGFFFNNTANATAGFEVPAGNGTHLIYSSSFWMGGTDINGQLKLAAQRYIGSGQDYWSGFLELGSGSPVANPFGQTIWQVTKAEIDNHILNSQTVGYVIPNDILNWPVHGDSTLGTLPYIAPFVDVNNDGVYDPHGGDYPCIKGDEAVYTIMNDRGNVHASGGDPISVELHYMFYQYSTVPGLEDVTFIDLEIVNMGTQTIFDFKTSYFLDADVGYGQDDYVGCDTTRNLIFAYNGDAVDESAGGQNGYGIPPALGVVCLSHSMDYSSVFSNGAMAPQTDPSTASEYYNVMQGNWTDGSDQLDGNGQSSDYMYYGDPNDLSAWSEMSEANIPGDRRMVMSTSLGVLGPLAYFNTGRRNLSYAVMHAQGTSNLNSVTELYQLADAVQSFYDGQNTVCFNAETASISELEEVDFTVYPNPSNGTFTIDLPEVEGEVEIEIVDLSGRVIFSETYFNTDRIQIDLDESNGMYVLKTKINPIGIGSHSSTKRLILD
ncbi:MAG: hypothetical protein ACJASQ_000275 [Crocinitomicaceae bacterium]|jgi:hypothetical protein